MSALCAAIGFSCEYTGKVAISRGKEIAATTLQAAAEAELYLAQAERAKAIVPLTVGASAALAAFALLAPALVSELVSKGFVEIVTEVYLLCPIFAILAAAIAALATQESVSLSSRAVGVGARRFASSDDVGRTWLSATEQIESSSRRAIYKWRSFSLGVLPAPFLAAIVPGPLSFKAIIASAVAAAQCAYSLAVVEFSLATAVESVALKARAAATSDTYANQGARAGAILPFTSALSGLCAATTVAIVEVSVRHHCVRHHCVRHHCVRHHCVRHHCACHHCVRHHCAHGDHLAAKGHAPRHESASTLANRTVPHS